jgi:hypothetical protein
MKRIMLLLVAALALSGVLGASTINATCTPILVSGTNTINSSVVCSQFDLLPGYVLNSATLYGVGGFTGGSGTLSTSIQFTFTGNGTQFASSGTSFTATGVYTANTGVPPNYAWGIGSTANLIGTGTVGVGQLTSTLSAGATLVPSGSITGDFFITYDYTDTNVPEPATIVFMGGGLLVLGALVRRRVQA